MNDYLLIFFIGLLGALHCAGMCGGLVMACGMRLGGGFSFSLPYNLGRITSYSVLGLIMGLLGKSLIAAGLFGRFQSVLPVIAGAFMVIVGLDLLGVTPKHLKSLTAGLFPRAVSGLLISGQLKKERPSAFVLGALNGLIPCGFLYAAGVKAASTADPVKGLLVMAALGAGTFMPMLFIGSLSGIMLKFRSNLLSTASSVLIIALGFKSIFYAAAGHIHLHM